MSDDEPRAWEYRPTGLVICPGLTFDEFDEFWPGVKQIHRSASLYLGDALVYAEDNYPELWSQLVDAHAVDVYKSAMWVCRNVPMARRHESLTYSHYRLVAKMESAEQERWILAAVAGDWHVRDLDEEIKAEKAREPGTNGGPHLHEPPPDGDVYEETPLPIDLDEPEVREEVPQSTLVKRDVPAPDADTAALGYTASDIRALIAGTREADAAITAGSAQQDRLVELSDGIAHALGCPAAPVDRLALIDAREALRLIPRGWKRALTHDGTDEGMWIVELRRGEGMAVGAANSLPVAICEAALSSLLSEIEP